MEKKLGRNPFKPSSAPRISDRFFEHCSNMNPDITYASSVQVDVCQNCDVVCRDGAFVEQLLVSLNSESDVDDCMMTLGISKKIRAKMLSKPKQLVRMLEQYIPHKRERAVS